MKSITLSHEVGFNDHRSLFQSHMKQASLDNEAKSL